MGRPRFLGTLLRPLGENLILLALRAFISIPLDRGGVRGSGEGARGRVVPSDTPYLRPPVSLINPLFDTYRHLSDKSLRSRDKKFKGR